MLVIEFLYMEVVWLAFFDKKSFFLLLMIPELYAKTRKKIQTFSSKMYKVCMTSIFWQKKFFSFIYGDTRLICQN